MSAPPGQISAKLALIAVLIPLALVAWYFAPLFLPVWRWQHLDFAQLAKQHNLPEAELQRQFRVVIRHAPRGDGDPVPWQIMTMDPPWDKADEDKLLVRATVISDRTGTPPSQLNLGSGHWKDKYFSATAWRLPPGSCGYNLHRPVLIYDGGSLEKLDIPHATTMESYIVQERWPNDDEDAEDGWQPPE
jgi:hypothetical protein